MFDLEVAGSVTSSLRSERRFYSTALSTMHKRFCRMFP